MSDLQFFDAFDVYVASANGLVCCDECAQDVGAGKPYVTISRTGSSYCADCFCPDHIGGDLFIDEIAGDFRLSEHPDRELLLKLALTDSPDWRHYPPFGANLSDYRGALNSPAIAQSLLAQMQSALATADSALAAKTRMRAIPVSASKLMIVAMSENRSPVVIPINM